MAGQFIESQLNIVSLNGMGILKCASLVLHIRIFRCELLMKFWECAGSVNSKENIQVGYRNSSRIVNWCVNKTSLNYGANTNLSFIITYEIPRLYLDEFNRKYPRRL